jgi:hypothetical protein
MLVDRTIWLAIFWMSHPSSWARDPVRQAIKDFLWSDQTGLPADYDQTEVEGRAEEVYRHVYRVSPTIPSPDFERDVVA